MAQQVKNPTSIQEDAVRSLVSLSGLRSRRCRELWCRSHPRLGCHPIAIAMAKAGSCGSNSTPRLGTFIRCKCGPKKKKKERKQLAFRKGRQERWHEGATIFVVMSSRPRAPPPITTMNQSSLRGWSRGRGVPETPAQISALPLAYSGA